MHATLIGHGQQVTEITGARKSVYGPPGWCRTSVRPSGTSSEATAGDPHLPALTLYAAFEAPALRVPGLLIRPDYVRPGSAVTPLARFWSASSAVRTMAVAGPLLQALFGRRAEVPALLTVPGLIQLGGSALGPWQRNPDMATAPAILGAEHLVSARHLRTTRC